MKHYDYIEWLLYKNNMLSEEKAEEMEQHLYRCDTCLEIFLSLIDENEEKHAAELVPDNFEAEVMKSLNKPENLKPKNKNIKKQFNYQFVYYAAVASVTIILTFTGFYTTLVGAVPKLSASVQTSEGKSNIVAQLSDSIVSTTSGLIAGIENNHRNNGGINNE